MENKLKPPCGGLLALGQWWTFCGETDMGQSQPVRCTECGGEYKLLVPKIPRRNAEQEQPDGPT